MQKDDPTGEKHDKAARSCTWEKETSRFQCICVYVCVCVCVWMARMQNSTRRVDRRAGRRLADYIKRKATQAGRQPDTHSVYTLPSLH